MAQNGFQFFRLPPNRLRSKKRLEGLRGVLLWFSSQKQPRKGTLQKRLKHLHGAAGQLPRIFNPRHSRTADCHGTQNPTLGEGTWKLDPLLGFHGLGFAEGMASGS